MIKNYLKIAMRNLLKNRLFTIINISGLAIGLALGIALLTVSWQAATRNPVEALRYE